MSDIADLYGVSISDIKKWNNLKTTSLKKGKMLKIWVDADESQLAEEKPRKVRT